LQDRKHEFALLMTLEMGKPFAEALDEVAYGGEFLRGRYGTDPEGTGRMIVSQHPGWPVFPHHALELPTRHGDAKIAPAIATPSCPTRSSLERDSLLSAAAAAAPERSLDFEDAGCPDS
jgi:succinate-semialdehyde dehydrogenase/glutarate-semialdehyde dehydrogenase